MAQKRILISSDWGQGHGRTGRQRWHQFTDPDAADHDRYVRPPPTGKDRQSAFVVTRAAPRFFDWHTGTLATSLNPTLSVTYRYLIGPVAPPSMLNVPSERLSGTSWPMSHRQAHPDLHKSDLTEVRSSPPSERDSLYLSLIWLYNRFGSMSGAHECRARTSTTCLHSWPSPGSVVLPEPQPSSASRSRP